MTDRYVGGKLDVGVEVGTIGHDDDAPRPFARNLRADLRHADAAVDRLPTRHRDRAVVQDLVEVDPAQNRLILSHQPNLFFYYIKYVIFYTIFFLSLIYGIFFVFPIGGADMPVVISLLNSFTGVAAACGGFLYGNKVMLTGGILVGAAGTLLTILMCKAMNRSLANVLIGSFGGSKAGPAGTKEQGAFKEISLADAAVVMTYANKVIIVPGYGLAVAQAQHVCHDLEKLLNSKNVEVKYAIHPVAGRMPGHMNVLLAEADVSYEKLEEMEQANEEFATTDVVLVLGANDVVNPAAKTDPS